MSDARLQPGQFPLKRGVRLFPPTRLGRVLLIGAETAVQGWVAHAAYGDTWSLRRSLLSTIVV